MPELPICTKCGYRHPVPRFDQLQLQRRNPCDRDPRALSDALDAVYDAIEARNHELLGGTADE